MYVVVFGQNWHLYFVFTVGKAGRSTFSSWGEEEEGVEFKKNRFYHFTIWFMGYGSREGDFNKINFYHGLPNTSLYHCYKQLLH